MSAILGLLDFGRGGTVVPTYRGDELAVSTSVLVR